MVDEVIADISSADGELHGKTVAIRGWLGNCGGLDCAVYSTPEDAELVAHGDWDSDEWHAAMDRRLAIGFDEDFDRSAIIMQFSEVVVYGEVNATYHRPADDSGSKFGCWDRCDHIKPKSIQKILF